MKKIHILLFSILLAVCCVVSASAAGFGSNNHGGGFGDGSHGGFGGSSHGGGFSGTTSNQGTGSGSSTPGYVSKPSYSENNIPARFYEDVNFYIKLINERLSIANGYLSNIGWLLIDARTYLANIDSIVVATANELAGLHNSVSWTNKYLAQTNTLLYEIGKLLDEKLSASGTASFDDANVLSAIGANTQAITNAEAALTGGLTRIADAIDYNFGSYSREYPFPVLVGQKSNNTVVSGVSSELFDGIDGTVLYSPCSSLTPKTFETSFSSPMCSIAIYLKSFSATSAVYEVLLRSYSVGEMVFLSNRTYTFYDLTGTPHPTKPLSLSSDGTSSWSYQTFTVDFSEYPDGFPVSTDPAAYEDPYIYNAGSSPVNVIVKNRFTAFQQLENSKLLNAVSSIPSPKDYTAQFAAIIDKLDNISGQLTDISSNSPIYDTWIIEPGGEDGQDVTVLDASKDALKQGSRLTKWLWKFIIKDSLGSADLDTLYEMS